MAKIADLQQRGRTWLTWGALLVVGGLVGQALPRSSASPKSETGTVTQVSSINRDSSISFSFKAKGSAKQGYRFADHTPWQAQPGGGWHSSGWPTCMTPGSQAPRRVTLGVITVQPVGSAPGGPMVVWVECGNS